MNSIQGLGVGFVIRVERFECHQPNGQVGTAPHHTCHTSVTSLAISNCSCWKCISHFLARVLITVTGPSGNILPCLSVLMDAFIPNSWTDTESSPFLLWDLLGLPDLIHCPALTSFCGVTSLGWLPGSKWILCFAFQVWFHCVCAHSKWPEHNSNVVCLDFPGPNFSLWSGTVHNLVAASITIAIPPWPCPSVPGDSSWKKNLEGVHLLSPSLGF